MCTRLCLLLLLLIAAHPAHAIPLSDLVNGGTLTSDGLVFSNWQADLTYNTAFPGAVEGFVTTRQATLADLQVTPISTLGMTGFQVNGFAWEGTVERARLVGSPAAPPYQMRLILDYTVTGLGNSSPTAGPTIAPGMPSGISADAVHALTATAPTGQADAIICPNTACRERVGVLPVGTTQATVRDALTISPFQNCAPGFVNCTFQIGQNPATGNSIAFFHAALSDMTAVPEPSTLALLVTGMMGLYMAKRKK